MSTERIALLSEKQKMKKVHLLEFISTIIRKFRTVHVMIQLIQLMILFPTRSRQQKVSLFCPKIKLRKEWGPSVEIYLNTYEDSFFNVVCTSAEWVVLLLEKFLKDQT